MSIKRTQFISLRTYIRFINGERAAPSTSPTILPKYRNLKTSALLHSGKLSRFSSSGTIKYPRREITVVATRMASSLATQLQAAEEDHRNGEVTSTVKALQDAVAIIRFNPQDERFQMQVTLNNGKVFNFDRKSSDPVSSVLSRMVANISKKVKNFNGTIKFLQTNSEDCSGLNEDGTEIKEILLHAVKNPPLKLQIGEEVYDVVFNPPEVYSVKFFSTYMPTLPVFPHKLETSDNFCRDESLYKWEFSREKPSQSAPAKLKKKSKDEDDAGSAAARESWSVCGSSLFFTPEKGMEGGYLKFTCIPSNGEIFGKPFSVVLPQPIASLPVESFIFQERLSRLPEKSQDVGSLRVLSYNILADTYATPEWFISSPTESLDAGYRFPLLNTEIKAYQADLICLQEVDEKYFYGYFQPFLVSEGYKGTHTSKTGDNTVEGIATFHNPSKLTQLDFQNCVIRNHMKTKPFWETLKKVGNNFIQRLEERNTVFHVNVFQVKNCSKNTILVVGNVHLYFHPDADHIRLLQTITCIDFLESKVAEVKKNYPGHTVAVIFCGDFNCTPPFSSYRLLTNGKVDQNDEDWISHSEEKVAPGISFSHSLNLTNSHPGEELTNITTCFEGCLDYILYQEEHLQLCGVCPPPSKEELVRLTKVDELRKVSLPNFYAPSDHLPLIADLKFKQ